MSRALDKGVKEALKCGGYEKIYQDIAEALTQRLEEPLDIELLGPSHPLEPDINFLQDENAIAIPKLRLVQAFIPAYQKLQIFTSQRDICKRSKELLDATAVLLLMDPENLTAVNIRKQLQSVQCLDPDPEDETEVLDKELYFTDSLLTSRLHRHTKSPTLWNHRRWIMKCFKELNEKKHRCLDFSKHFKVIFVSGERHPRNYYAWCHARYLITTFDPDLLHLATILEDTKKWCFNHHDDVSGWMFLMFLLERNKEHVQPVINETIRRVKSFTWRNESVWHFLRLMAAAGHCQEEILHTLEGLQKGAGSDKRTLDQAASYLRPNPVDLQPCPKTRKTPTP